MANRKPCCGRSKRVSTVDFCGGMRISSGVTLVKVPGGYSIQVKVNGILMDIMRALINQRCPTTGSGYTLAVMATDALKQALEMGKEKELAVKAGRQVPLILLKDYLYGIAGL